MLSRGHRAVARVASRAWALAPRARLQRRLFAELAHRFPDRLAATAAHGAESLTTDYWARWQAELRWAFSPAPPFDFLRHPIVLHTMFVAAGGRWLEAQIGELKGRFGRRGLRRLVVEDPVGSPYLRSLGYWPSHNRVHHAYHLLRFERSTHVRVSRLGCGLEWGGGYGDLALVFCRWHGRNPTYVIVDLPLMSCLQWLYLSTALSPDRVRLVGVDAEEVETGCVNLVPVGLVDRVSRADLFVSTWALSESTESAERLVLERNWFGAEHLLLSFSGGTLGDRAAAAAARLDPVGSFLPGATYAFR